MDLPAITLSSDIISHFNEAIQKEWVISNGLGGYAASTILGLNTRKYHGLLVAALDPPRNRTVCLEKIDEDILSSGSIYRLGTGEFQNGLFPQGYQFLKTFSISAFPSFTYQVKNITLKKTVFLPDKKNAAIVFYNIINRTNDEAELHIFPLLTCRHFHNTIDLQKNPLNFQQEHFGRNVTLNFENPDAIVNTYASEGDFVEKPNWIKAMHYREERVRGESDSDDCYQPGYYKLVITPNKETSLAIATSIVSHSANAAALSKRLGSSTEDFKKLLATTLEEKKNCLNKFYNLQKNIQRTSWLDWILLSSDSFVTRENDRLRSVIAGYYWFESWSRDTLISLPGLMLVTGRFYDAKSVLLNYISYCRKGLIPNLIIDASGQPVYNTVDATLWYVNAVLQYLKYTADFNFVKEFLWKSLKDIAEKHELGTDFGIRMDSDGLLSHGPQLTWMDAGVAGEAITPRAGKAVEIQALWYNALRILALLANKFGEKNLADKYLHMAEKAKVSFNEKFWNSQNNCLFDVVESSKTDSSLRPNQIFAISLDFIQLDANKSQRVIDFIQKELLTICGLRTLSPSDPHYKSKYKGNMIERDQAYHNGVVWPWLLGPFVTGFLKVKPSANSDAHLAMQTVIQGLFERQIYEGGLGTVNELFDSDFPHKPRGCISQSWSIAEPLRAYIEDVLQIRPQYEKEILRLSL